MHLRYGESNIFNKFIKAKCISSNSNCDKWDAATDLYTTIRAPPQPLQPSLSISGANILGPCDTLTLDLTSSTGKAGRPWGYSNLHITGIRKSGQSIDVTTLKSLLDKSTNNDTLLLPFSYFPTHGKYNLMITKCNFLLACSTKNHIILVRDANILLQYQQVGLYSPRLMKIQNGF